ncbi:hypothetical protein BH10ACT1_BH10ACT1_19890 [soil metagenome]
MIVQLHPERAAINAALYGVQAMAYLNELKAVGWTDPWCAKVAAALVDVLRRSTSRRYEHGVLADLVRRELIRNGHCDLVDGLPLVDVTLAGGSVHGLGIYLAEIAEAAQRERLRLELVRLADALDRPGGPARVAEMIGAQ